MKKSAMNFLLVAALLSGLLSACSGNTDNFGLGFPERRSASGEQPVG